MIATFNSTAHTSFTGFAGLVTNLKERKLTYKRVLEVWANLKKEFLRRMLYRLREAVRDHVVFNGQTVVARNVGSCG